MKALAIDSSTPCITFTARNDDKLAQFKLDIGMHQSEQMLPSIEQVLKLVELEPKDLQFMALALGPGTFTGLRLSFAALKALELAFDIPLYGIPTLEALAYPFASWKGAVIPVIDAKKDRWYGAIYRSGELCQEPQDGPLEAVLSGVDKEEHALAVGIDSDYFVELVRGNHPEYDISYLPAVTVDCGTQLLALAEKKFAAGEPGLADYDGPVYIRPSEAEEAYIKKITAEQ